MNKEYVKSGHGHYNRLKELVGYSKLLQRARDDAYQRMIEDAKSKGANAIIAFRFQTSTITKGASEVVAYGTAVKI